MNTFPLLHQSVLSPRFQFRILLHPASAPNSALGWSRTSRARCHRRLRKFSIHHRLAAGCGNLKPTSANSEPLAAAPLNHIVDLVNLKLPQPVTSYLEVKCPQALPESGRSRGKSLLSPTRITFVLLTVSIFYMFPLMARKLKRKTGRAPPSGCIPCSCLERERVFCLAPFHGRSQQLPTSRVLLGSTIDLPLIQTISRL